MRLSFCPSVLGTFGLLAVGLLGCGSSSGLSPSAGGAGGSGGDAGHSGVPSSGGSGGSISGEGGRLGPDGSIGADGSNDAASDLSPLEACNQILAAICERAFSCGTTPNFIQQGYNSASECAKGWQSQRCIPSEVNCGPGQTYRADLAKVCVEGFRSESCTDFNQGLEPAVCSLVCSGPGGGSGWPIGWGGYAGSVGGWGGYAGGWGGYAGSVGGWGGYAGDVGGWGGYAGDVGGWGGYAGDVGGWGGYAGDVGGWGGYAGDVGGWGGYAGDGSAGAAGRRF